MEITDDREVLANSEASTCLDEVQGEIGGNWRQAVYILITSRHFALKGGVDWLSKY